MVLAESKASLVFSCILIINGACWKQGIISVLLHTYYYSYFYSGQSLARNSSRTVCLRPLSEVSNRPAHWGEVCYDFYKRSGVRCLPQGRKSGQKSPIDLTLRQTLTTPSSERGFHINLWFATFEEADRLCKNIPHNGVKVAPLGGRSVPKFPIDLQWCRTAHEMGRPTHCIGILYWT